MAFQSKVTLSDDQLATDAEENPGFVRALDARLRTEYPDYTIGTWVRFAGQGWVQWSLVAVTGASHGFRVIFRLPNKNPAEAKLKVVRFSRIFGYLMGASVVLALVVAVALKLSDQAGLIAAFLITVLPLLLIAWLLSGTIAHATGKALPEEELQKIGQLVLERLR